MYEVESGIASWLREPDACIAARNLLHHFKNFAIHNFSDSIMARTLNIAILECDSAIQKIAEIYGQYGDICAKLLAQSLKALDLSSPIQFKFTSWDVVNKELYPELQAIDAILIPGSSK